ncbi:hypothetical protein [Paludisphaera borealis]|uniref:Uncharacterized protein n=1 Tax=Paludisphaera borealis TaxID=1387353 RepID=A0A1U7CX67_9BACT|nr:hypothetical protein [Paludisphaera borealis]APW63473.1 hypothetical protein BSF38_05044 [Paludisphaera borealis]
MNAMTHSMRSLLAALPLLSFVSPGCDPPKPPVGPLPPAYTSNQITDPALLDVTEEVQTWTSQQADDGQKPLYSHAEVLSPVPIVQPYGVGVFQQEVRLPVIFTTGPGWNSLKLAEKEAAVALAYREIAVRLQALNHEPALQPTLTVQTPQGMELAWINRLDPGGKNVHGDD